MAAMSTDHLTSSLTRHDGLLGFVLTGIPDDALHQGLAKPDGATNSIAWILAHLARTRGSMLAVLGRPDVAEPWEDAVARGAKRDPRPVDAAIALAVFRRRGDLLRQAIPAASVEFWAQPFPRPMPDGSTTNGPVFAFLCFHEAFHLGQIDLIKVGLGFGGIA